MLERGVLAPATPKPIESELPRAAGLAGLLAAVPSALGTLGQGGSLREYVPILALILLVTLGVFWWGIPAALDLDEPGAPAFAMALSCLSLVTLLLFWTGLPAVLAAGGIVLGRSQLAVPEDRRVALAAIRIGTAAVVLYFALVLVDLL